MGDKRGFGLVLVRIPPPYCSEKERACLNRQKGLGVGDPARVQTSLHAIAASVDFLCLRLSLTSR